MRSWDRYPAARTQSGWNGKFAPRWSPPSRRTTTTCGRRSFIAAGTARIHLFDIYAKLEIVNRAPLTALTTAGGIDERSSAH